MRFSFNPFSSLIIIRAKISGPLGYDYVRLALDTGATRTTVRPGRLSAIGYNLAIAPQQGTRTGSGTTSARVVTLDNMEALGQQRNNLVIMALNLPPSVPVDGLLGLDFLRGTNLNIDFPNGRITLT